MPSKAVVKFNIKPLVQKQERAWQAVNEKRLEEGFNYSLEANVWDWPRETQREGGGTAGSPRNVHDSGDLIDSYYRQRQGRTTYVHGWAVPYSLAVHEGAQLRNGTILPARPWSKEAVKHIPQYFAEEYRKLS